MRRRDDTRLTTKGVALGTPTYMAPEQAAANEHIDPSESPDNGRNFNLRIHWDPTFADMWGYGPWDALMAPR